MSTDIAMMEEEKKSQDSASLTSLDVESVSYPEKPEFQETVEDDDDKESDYDGVEMDSILGNNTIEQMYDNHIDSGGRSIAEDSWGFSAHPSMSEDDPNAPLRLAILGPEDDLSTIAGDTISGSVATEGAVFTNDNLAGIEDGGGLVQRDFSEYELKTPTKQKRRRWHPYQKRDEEEDEHTQPETPPAMIGVPSKSINTSNEMSGDDKEGDASTYFTHISPSRKVYIWAAVIGAVLILAIGGLAIAYLSINGDDDGDSSSASKSVTEEAPVGGFTPDDFAPSDSDLSPVSTPVAQGEPTPAPVILPTMPPIPVPAGAQMDLVEVLSANSVDVTSFLQDFASPQYRALQWLAADPAYSAYTQSRLIQRWALAVLILGMAADTARVNSASLVIDGWLDYEVNECDWFSTYDGLICNGLGSYERLQLQDQQFYGTIPSEISLLSPSLKFFDMRGNNLGGTIPSEVSELSLLQRFQVTVNVLTGTIPTEIGLLANVEVLGLGRNQLDGPLPTELGNLARMSTLGLASNNLSGPIPEELGDINRIKILVLGRNNLSGTIPNSLGNLENLETLEIGFNALTGEVPWQVCDLRQLNQFEADCHSVECDCCTQCTPIPDPTLAPTTPPTKFPTATPTASSAPTRSPTAPPTTTPDSPAPTACTSNIQWVPSCIDIGDELEISFQNCDPEFGDWIGIYDKNADPTNLQDPYLWVWSCGSQNCRGTPQGGTVTLAADDIDIESGMWPLERGDYFAFLIRNSGAPSTAFLQSEKRKIREDEC